MNDPVIQTRVDWDKAGYYGNEVMREVKSLIQAYREGNPERMRQTEINLESTLVRFKIFAR